MELNKEFLEGEIQMTVKWLLKCSASLAIEGM